MSCHSEIRILVYSLRDQAGDVLIAEDEGESGGERGGGLNGWESDLADVMAVVEPEYPSHLVECGLLG